MTFISPVYEGRDGSWRPPCPCPGRLDGRRRATEAAASLGEVVRQARKRRRWSQHVVGEKVGLSSQRIGQLEQGKGSAASLETWFALGDVLGIPLRVSFQRDPLAEVADAGHLKVQDLALRVGRETGRVRSFEVPTKPADPALSIDVHLRDDVLRMLFIVECWNTFGNVNASVRSTRRKIAEAEALAAALAGDVGPYRVAAVWIVRDTHSNREVLRRYPNVFSAAFTGSSAGWVKALTSSLCTPPTELGLVWCDVNATRLFAWRQTDR